MRKQSASFCDTAAYNFKPFRSRHTLQVFKTRTERRN